MRIAAALQSGLCIRVMLCQLLVDKLERAMVLQNHENIGQLSRQPTIVREYGKMRFSLESVSKIARKEARHD